MPNPTKITKSKKTYFVDDGANRGPMTMFRVAFHPSEPKLLAQCADRRLACWNLDGEVEQIKGRKDTCVVGQFVCPHEIGWIRSFDVHPAGREIVTGGSDRTLRLWKWTDGRPDEQSVADAKAHNGWVDAVAYSPDGSQLATAGADSLVKIWDAKDLKPIKTLAGHEKYVCDVAFSPDGKLLVSGAEDGLVFVRDANTYDELRRIEFGSANDQYGQIPKHSGVHRLAISYDNRWLSVAGGETLNVYELTTGEIVATERVQMDVTFHPSCDVLVGGESEAKVWLCHTAKFAPPEKDKNGKPKSPGGISGTVLTTIKRGSWSLGLRFSGDGKHLALGKSDGAVELYDVV
jgi:WD40 repeat protein